MSATPGTTATTGTTTILNATLEAEHQPATRSIRCEVRADGTLMLIPCDALGAYYLNELGKEGGTLRPTWHYRGIFRNGIAGEENTMTEKMRQSLTGVSLRENPRPKPESLPVPSPVKAPLKVHKRKPR